MITVLFFKFSITLVRVGYGSSELRSLEVTESEKITIHPEYNEARRLNDIAIVFVVDEFDFTNPNVVAIALPAPDTKVARDGSVKAHTVGFGFTAAGQTAPNSKLLAASVTIIEARRCERLFRKSFEHHLCARDQAKRKAANVCLGDNGNGLYALPSELKPKEDKTQQNTDTQDNAQQNTDTNTNQVMYQRF